MVDHGWVHSRAQEDCGYCGNAVAGRLSVLRGEEIPLGARLFAVIGTLDAITSERPTRKALKGG